MADYLVKIKDASGFEIHGQIKVDGQRTTTFGRLPEEIADNIHNMVNLPVRDDDVMFSTAPKSGTHWGFEIISMLLNGNAETVPLGKIVLMLEHMSADELEKVPSPRVLNSHFPLSMLPRQMKEKKTKIILMLRNPKDVSVSFYYHHKGLMYTNYEGTFADHHQLFIEGQLEYGDWFDLVRGWEKDMEKGEYNIHLVYYEDLQKNGLEVIRNIARFLGVPENMELFQEIHDKCQIKKMTLDKMDPPEIVEKTFNPGFNIFRKGEIGDWKNHFTVAMNEEFDALFKERMKDSKLQFQFT